MMMITGGTGILGRELLKLFPESIHPKHDELELSDRDAVFSFIKNNESRHNNSYRSTDWN